MVFGMLVVGAFLVTRFVITGNPGAEIDQLASLGAKRTKAIRRRHVSRFFAIGTGHRNSTQQASYNYNEKLPDVRVQIKSQATNESGPSPTGRGLHLSTEEFAP
jgi:hypothetical protein